MTQTIKKIGSVIGSGAICAIFACVIKGAMLGWEQMDSGFGWLSIPIDALSAPALIVVDLLSLSAPSGAHHFIVLPWAAVGFILGAMGGYQSDRPAA